jgi:hypothetical protein
VSELNATLGIRGPEEYGVLFEYLHALVRREATERLYQVVAPSISALGVEDADRPGTEVADEFRAGAPLERLMLPPFRVATRSAGAGSEGMRLRSDEPDWLEGERRRWLAGGGREELVVIEGTREVEAPALPAFAILLRVHRWLWTAVASASPASLEARTIVGRQRAVARRALGGAARPCPSCQVAHADDACTALLRAASPPAALRAVDLEARRARAIFTPTDGVEPATAYARGVDVPTVDAALGAWDDVARAPLDVVAAGSTRIETQVDVMFDEAGQRRAAVELADAALTAGGGRVELGAGGLTLASDDDGWLQRWLIKAELAFGSPLAAGFSARRPARYEAPTWPMLFKALAWLDAQAPKGRAVRVQLASDEAFDLPLEGAAAPCDACGLTHRGRVCVELVARATPDTVASLSISQRADARLLELRPLQRVARVVGERHALQAPLDAWAALEAQVWP